VEKKIRTIKHFCFSEMEVTWEKILYFFYAVLRPNQYFTPSEAFISKLEDTINIPWYNTVTVYASNTSYRDIHFSPYRTVLHSSHVTRYVAVPSCTL
jgi:hypothetical protein